MLPSGTLPFSPSPTAGPVRADRVNRQSNPRASFDRHAETAHTRVIPNVCRSQTLAVHEGTSGTACSTDGRIVSPVQVRGLRVGSRGVPTHEGRYQNSTCLPQKGKIGKGP